MTENIFSKNYVKIKLKKICKSGMGILKWIVVSVVKY